MCHVWHADAILETESEGHAEVPRLKLVLHATTRCRDIAVALYVAARTQAAQVVAVLQVPRLRPICCAVSQLESTGDASTRSPGFLRQQL